jgi:prolyl oligopeptidase
VRYLWMIAALTACPKPPPPPAAPTATPAYHPPYPDAPRGDVVDDYFGHPIADPYRWLEDLDSAETKAWVSAENQLTRSTLDAIPFRAAVAERLAQLWSYERWGAPVHRGDRYFYEYNDGTWDQNKLFTSPTLDAEPRPLIDPNTLSADGTVSVAAWSVSDDGRYVAYGVADAGSDWQTWRVRDAGTGADLADELRWVKFSGASWTPDHKGFFYARFPEPVSTNAMEERLANQSLWYHKVGTPQSADTLIYERLDQPDWGFDGSVTHDGKRLVITITEGTEEKNRVYWVPLSELKLAQTGGVAGGKVRQLFDAFDATYAWVGEKGDKAYIYTDKDAPQYRLVAVDLKNPGALTPVLREGGGTLTAVSHVGGRFVAQYLDHAQSVVRVFDDQGALVSTVPLPGVGTAGGFGGAPEDTEVFYSFSGFTTPGSVYRYDTKRGESSLWRAPHVDFDPSVYTTEQVEYTSKDGTRVPMFIVHRNDAPRDGSNPTLLYGYGGFNIPLTPSFSVANLMWLEMGGIYAVANLRGGGELGREWHEAGTKCEKQNVFDDFIAAGEHLIAEKWTSTPKLGIHGRSNGGLLVGAAVTQRPDLWGAAIPGVGVHDMLRYQRFTIGWAWAGDYGTSADSEQMFQCLAAYSPVHNTRAGTAYPPTMVTTGDHDDRVVPGHSYKFAASLQHDQAGPAPVLIRIETRAGHGAGTPVSMLVEEVADRWSFLAWALHYTPTSLRSLPTASTP